MKTINTLSNFKTVLQSAKTKGIQLKSTLLNKEGKVILDNGFAPVAIVQSNSFALERNGKTSWAEFGKASEWSFELDNKKASRQFKDGSIITFEFSDIVI